MERRRHGMMARREKSGGCRGKGSPPSDPPRRDRRTLLFLRAAAPIFGILGSPLLRATPVYEVGSFAKSTVTSPLPATQSVDHGLGVTPKALILWTNGGTDKSFGSFLFALGWTDGKTSRSVSYASEDGADVTNASRRMAPKAITIVRWGETLEAEADLSSWDAKSFTLSWSSNNDTAYVIHFLAIGGSEVAAKVLGWTLATTTGNASVTGVGFEPDIVLFAHIGDRFTDSPPASRGHGLFGLGVMDRSGDQWALAVLVRDAVGISDTYRVQRTDSCIVDNDGKGNIDCRASFVSMDSDGFTIDFHVVGLAGQAISLALKGVNAKAGSFAKTTSTFPLPASQQVKGVEIRPEVVLLASFQTTSQANPLGDCALGIGASDGTREGSSALHDEDGADLSDVDRIDKTSKAFIKVDNDSASIDAECDLASFDDGAFTLSWTTNDAVASEILYIALGSLSPTAVALLSFTVTVEREGIRIRWRTAHEVDTLGFRILRGARPDGPFVPIALELILAAPSSFGPRSYEFLDSGAIPGAAHCYRLEAIDLLGRPSIAGSACIDDEGGGRRVGSFVRGDVNADGRIDIADMIRALMVQFSGAPASSCRKAEDLDDDGAIDLDDALFGLCFLFGAGSAPPPPIPDCDLDPTPDALDCESHEPCR